MSSLGSGDCVQFVVPNVALYRLPSHTRLDSVDFEQCILDCVQNKLDEEKPESVLSKRMISEVKVLCNPDLCGNHEGGGSADEQCRFVVGIEAGKLLWSVLDRRSPTVATPIDFHRLHCYLQSPFAEIRLCYVNFQLPKVIIWLLSSIPQRIVNSDSPMIATSQLQQATSSCKSDSLFALVWKCSDEQNVVKLREIYKHLRLNIQTIKRKDQILFLKTPDEERLNKEMFNKNHAVTNQKSQPFSKEKMGLNQISSRQRQPAKLIQEKPGIHLHLSDKRLESNLYLTDRKVPICHFVSYHVIQSESEFDASQIDQYLSHRDQKSTKRVPRFGARVRSRSVDPARHRYRGIPLANEPNDISTPSISHDATSSVRECDRLNSEGSSLSGESTSGEISSPKEASTSNSTSKLPVVVKSALKKSSSYFEEGSKPRNYLLLTHTLIGQRSKARDSTRSCSNYSKKNVTFSAYATIQMVDN